jgi:hypothetical protein
MCSNSSLTYPLASPPLKAEFFNAECQLIKRDDVKCLEGGVSADLHVAIGDDTLGVAASLTLDDISSKPSLSDFNVGLHWAPSGDFTGSIASSNNMDAVNFGFHQSLNAVDKSAICGSFVVDPSKNAPYLYSVGYEYAPFADSFLKAKLDTTGALGLALSHQRLFPQVKVSASYAANINSVLAPSAIGLKLQLGEF